MKTPLNTNTRLITDWSRFFFSWNRIGLIERKMRNIGGGGSMACSRGCCVTCTETIRLPVHAKVGFTVKSYNNKKAVIQCQT